MNYSELTSSDGSPFLVDDCDVENIKRYTWVKDSNGYIRRSKGTVGHEYLHRLVSFARNSECVDHINGNRLDNRRGNLRIVTVKQNSYNSSLSKNNTSGYKGVSAYKDRWRAYIAVDGRQKHLGTFYNVEDAAEAYNIAAKDSFGEHARFNEVRGWVNNFHGGTHHA